MISYAYAHAARARRRYYERPGRRRRLDRPVISVGNLVVGGSGKTPMVAHLARLLRDTGERPSILSRGYARRDPADGVVVVSDGHRICSDLARSGDEPLMLARSLDKVAVLASPDRYLAGRLAELRFGCTVHLLDDGFQHLELERDIDLLMVRSEDLLDTRTLPAGRLRESLAAAKVADGILVTDATSDEAREVGSRLGVSRVFLAIRTLESALRQDGPSASVPVLPDGPVFAVAGIARPERFFADVARAGWSVVGTRAFPDHYRYTLRDVQDIVAEAQAARAQFLMTTEKDLMRLLPFGALPLPLAWIPLRLVVEPAAEFRGWLAAELAAALESRLASRATDHSRSTPGVRLT
jgi:tetraacyldisaccharide 4'-kinase